MQLWLHAKNTFVEAGTFILICNVKNGVNDHNKPNIGADHFHDAKLRLPLLDTDYSLHQFLDGS